MPDAIDLLIRAYKNKIESLNLGFNVWTKLAPDTENGNCYIQIGVINGNTILLFRYSAVLLKLTPICLQA
jgi:hypothetical protein